MAVEKTNYEFKEIVAEKGFTFWDLYTDNEYYQIMTYNEALYYFEKDNNMKSYQVIEGQTLKIRVRKEAN